MSHSIGKQHNNHFPFYVPSTELFLKELEVVLLPKYFFFWFYLSVLECKTFMGQIFKNWYSIVFASSDVLYFNLIKMIICLLRGLFCCLSILVDISLGDNSKHSIYVKFLYMTEFVY